MLCCKKITFSNWKNNCALQALGDIITKCLHIAEELSLKSITFPAIGTGNLGFPKSVVAKLLFDKVFEFSSKNRVNSLEEVHFLLHPKDTANIQVSYYVFLSLLRAVSFGSISWYLAIWWSPKNPQGACSYTEEVCWQSLLSVLKVLFLILPPVVTCLSCTALLPSCPLLFPGSNTDATVITLYLMMSPNSSVCR